MRRVQHYAIALWKISVNPAVTALLGLILAAVFLLLFASDLSLILEDDINGLIVSFVLCGLGAGLGFIVLRRLFPGREPISLFDGSVDLSIQSTTRAKVRVQTVECLAGATKNARPAHSNAQIAPVMKSHRNESVATYNTHDSAGALGLVTIIGLGSALAMRFTDGWQFLLLTVLAGCALALLLYWRQGSGISEYRIPATGGVIGLIATTGMGVIMMRFHALRYFFVLVIVSGCAIALLLRWLHRRGRSGSLIQLHVSPGDFSRTMPTE